MKKRLLAFAMAVILCFMLCSCGKTVQGDATGNGEKITAAVTDGSETTATETTSAQTDVTDVSVPDASVPDDIQQGATPILYKVSDEKGNVIWLFGSIHVGRDSFYPLPDYVMDAYEGSDALAVEFDTVAYQEDMSAQMNSMTSMIYTDGTTIKDHISEETYSGAVEIMKEAGYYNSLLDYYHPVMWWSLIESIAIEKTGANAELGIDTYFLNLAKEDGKEIREVESAEFQFGMLVGFSPELQAYMLTSSVATFSEIEAMIEALEELMNLWASGNETAFTAYLSAEDEYHEAEAELYEEYHTAMYTDRNNSMTDYAVDALSSGDEVFICVGAAHIIGEDAVADNLSELGYTVEIVR